MTEHLHTKFVEGCFRCDLNRDEVGAYRIALRNDDDDRLDDVVVNNVSVFRAEIMDDKALFMACYFPDSDDRITFWVRVEKGKLRYHVTEWPPPSEQFVYEDQTDA
jgi:hypothetical protein